MRIDCWQLSSAIAEPAGQRGASGGKPEQLRPQSNQARLRNRKVTDRDQPQ